MTRYTLGMMWDGEPDPEAEKEEALKNTRAVSISFDLDSFLDWKGEDETWEFEEWFAAWKQGGQEGLLSKIKNEHSSPSSMARDFNVFIDTVNVTLSEGGEHVTVEWRGY